MSRGRYRRVQQSFWTDPDIQQLTPEQKLLLLYYFTGPHMNMAGLYYLPLMYASAETGLRLELVREWTASELSEFVTYDPETSEILVHAGARHQVDTRLAKGDKRRVGIERLLAEAHSAHLVNRFVELHADWGLDVEKRGIEGALVPLVEVAEGASKPEQAQEQVQEQAQCGSNEPGEPDDDDTKLRAALAPAVREHLWLGDDPPGSDWSMGREISIAKELGLPPDESEGLCIGIRHLVNAGKLGHVEPGDPCTLRVAYNQKSGATPVVNLALHYWRKHGTNGSPEKRKRRGLEPVQVETS